MNYLARIIFLCSLAVSSIATVAVQGQEPFFLFFDGSEQLVQKTFTNPYTGETEVVDRVMNVSTNNYTGGASDIDTLIFTSLADLFALKNPMSNQVLESIEYLTGGSGGDIIILADANLDYAIDTYIDGESGNDLLWTSTGNDTIFGGSGNDKVNGGPGNDLIYGESGNDDLRGASGIDILHGGTNNDLLTYHADSTWSAFESARNLQVFANNAGDPTNPIPKSAALRVPLSAYNQSYDLFNGGEGTDILDLSEGNDAIFLHDSYSSFSGNPDDPRIVEVEYIFAFGGDDLVDLSSPTLTYGDVKIYGGEGNDIIQANAGNDELYGENGNDKLDGNSGSDIIQGGDGDDTIWGRAGDDVLAGQSGNNTIYMGEGYDFVFTSEGTDALIVDHFDDLVDAIAGFETTGTGKDTLNLSEILEYDSLSDTVEDFVTLTEGTGAEIGTTGLYVSPEGNGTFTQIAVFDKLFSESLTDLLANGNFLLEGAEEFFENADFDNDGDVDGSDFLAWQAGFGPQTNATHQDGDTNGDGKVDAEDFAIFRNQYGTMLLHGNVPTNGTGALATVPEPSTLLVSIVSLCVLSISLIKKRLS